MIDFLDNARLRQQFLITEITGWTFVASFLWLIQNGVIQTFSDFWIFASLAFLLISNILLHRILIKRVNITVLFVIESFVYLFFVYFFVHLTGGLNSFFWFLYFIPIMISLVVLDSRNCFLMLAGAIFFTLSETVPAYTRDEYGSISLGLLQILGLSSFTSFGYFLNRWVILEKMEKDNALFEYQRELKLSKGLAELTRYTLQGKSFEIVLKQIVSQTCDILMLKRCGLWIKSNILGNRSFSAVSGYQEVEFHQLYEEIWQQVQNKRVKLKEIEKTDERKISYIEKLEIKNIASEPLAVLISCDFKKNTGWNGIFVSDDLKSIEIFEKRFLSSIAQMISLGLQNQKVVLDLNKAIEEKSSKIADLLILYEITKRMAIGLELKPTIGSIIEMAIGSVNASFCMIVLVDDHNKLFCAGIHGAVSAYPDEEILNLPDGLFRRIINKGRILSTLDVEQTIFQKTYQSLTARYHMKSFLGCPLISKDTVKGALIIFSVDERDYSQSERQLVETLADHAVIAIENATTYELLQSKKQELEKSQMHLEKINTELIHQQRQLLETSEELETANRDLKRLNEIKNEFVATVSHELRTPLTSVKESVVLVLDEIMGPLNEEQKKFLSITRNNIERLSRLINDLLDLSKLDSGKLSMRKGKINLFHILKTVSESYEPARQEKKIAYTCQLEDQSLWINADPDRLNQVMYNLLNNAYKFTPADGHVHLRLQKVDQEKMIELIQRGVFENNAMNQNELEKLIIFKEFAMIGVEDDGVEIQKSDIKKIFEKFTQVRLGEKSQEGTGLGLPIVKQILLMHHGGVWVEVAENKHKIFKICIPLYQEAIVQDHLAKKISDHAIELDNHILLLLFEFIDEINDYTQIKKTIRELSKIENIIRETPCEVAKDVFRMGLRHVLVVIYGGDQAIASDQTEKIRQSIEKANLREWASQMHFVLSDVPMNTAIQENLINKLIEMNVYQG